ncbi:hypothetical protein [Hymenobacter cavernae]|uniref:hypothetical protein n=1 Tax=Hymenobacter cavernae TaxID=2044852 RepID=UPI001667F3DC|nr:hypothetical protein [Hymenobacter cavernae]
MSAPTPTAKRAYVSRRKRHSSTQNPSSVSSKLMVGVIGLLLLGLLVSLGIIATNLVSPASADVADNVITVVPTSAQPR